MKIKIEHTTQEDKAAIKVFCPYDDQFIKGAGNSSGKFSNSQNCWIFPARSEAKTRALLIEIFGTDDTATSPKVDVRVTFPNMYYANKDAIRLAGRMLARATSRDSGAILGDDVELVSGWVRSDGSAKNWETRTSEGSVYEIFDFEASKLEELRALDFIEVEVIGGEEIEDTITIKELVKFTGNVKKDEKATFIEYPFLVVVMNHDTKTIDVAGRDLLMTNKQWKNAYSIFSEIVEK
ncbi:hypothetical protein ALQ37_200095 [Pseudomonas syringae pv. aptata]|uniref:Uncharacterized protein n=1 Tax=Pseudomonas syringae pv. aptata TaxID=83167 RepID=A0A0Q0BTJ5_PSEAP|nr:hypothetical protein [Pseudomonas syringae]KPY97918.1 Uncharacterized protein ALO85_04140 [Pseudomonas syringae pv. aptata]RMO65395.1 hypothetical protein ALQ37_200095 [Pseudomonas syringae pv. aptata]